jgi:hypothetical protein
MVRCLTTRECNYKVTLHLLLIDSIFLLIHRSAPNSIHRLCNNIMETLGNSHALVIASSFAALVTPASSTDQEQD